jgi:hypothetical protein
MNINKFLNTVKYLNFLIENVSSDDVDNVKGSIERTKEKMDLLNARIQSRLMYDENAETLPFNKITIDFTDKIKTSVRSAVKKTEYEFYGQEKFNVVGFSDDYIILQKNDWDYRIGLFLYYETLQRRSRQFGELQLFYNEYGYISSGEKTRSGLKEEVTFEIIETK